MRPLLLALLVASAAAAQPGWRPVPEGPSVSVDALVALGDDFPLIGNAADPTAEAGRIDIVSSALLIGARVPVTGPWTAVVEVPVAYARYTFEGGPPVEPEPGLPTVDPSDFDGADVGLGNPYLGAELRATRALTVGLGVRPPLAREQAPPTGTAEGWQGGLRADVERFEAYLPRALTLSGTARLDAPVGSVGRVRLSVDPALVIDTDEFRSGDQDKATPVLGYALHGDLRVGPATLSAGLVDRALYGDRYRLFETNPTVVLGVAADVAGVRPGVLLRLPTDGQLYGTDATLAVTLDVPFLR